MSAETVAFVELVRAAANTTRLYCIKCDGDQAHQLIIAPATTTVGSGSAEYWACVRCGNVQGWTLK